MSRPRIENETPEGIPGNLLSLLETLLRCTMFHRLSKSHGLRRSMARAMPTGTRGSLVNRGVRPFTDGMRRRQSCRNTRRGVERKMPLAGYILYRLAKTGSRL